MVCFKIVFSCNACLFPIFPFVCIGSHFHHGGLVDCQSLCSSQCFLFVVFVTCHALCFLCLFSNLLSGCKKNPSKLNCLFAFYLRGALPNPIKLLEKFDLFSSQCFSFYVLCSFFTCLPFAEFGFQTTLPCCQDATFKYLCLILVIKAAILFLIVLLFIPSFCLLFCKTCFASCSVASCSVLLLSFSWQFL